MPRVRGDGPVVNRCRDVAGEAIEALLHKDHNNKNNESKSFGRGMRLGNGAESSDNDPGRGEQEHHGDDGGGQGLGFAVAVGVVFIRRRLGKDDAAPDDDGTENIGERFHRIGNEGVGMSEDARGHFDGGEDGVCAQSEKGAAETILEA